MNVFQVQFGLPELLRAVGQHSAEIVKNLDDFKLTTVDFHLTLKLNLIYDNSIVPIKH